MISGDVPLYAGLDTMKLTAGALTEAESRAARLWGADFCRFSTGGATHANQAVALAVAGDGDTVVVSRTLHRSLLLRLVLAGLTPVWVRPEVDPSTGLPLGVAPETVRRALTAHPEARAVFVGDPSYVGTVGDIAALADAAHDHGVEARDRLRAVGGLTVLDGPSVDPPKLTLVLSGTGADGNQVERDLLATGLPVESADRDVIVAVV